MEELMKYYENKLFIVWIDNIEYTAVFRNIEDELGFEINHYKKISRNIVKRKIDLLEGLIGDRRITIIEPMLFLYDDENVAFKFDMMLDGFFLEKNVKNKKIKSFECSYYGLNKFDFLSCINHEDGKKFKINCQRDLFKLKKGELDIIRSGKISYNKNEIKINKINCFKQKYTNNVNIFEAVKDIWHLKNLFSIFSKKEIGVEKISVYCDSENDAILFMNLVKEPKYNYKDELSEIMENRFLIHYEDIKNNFEEIYINSKECFKRIEPILQIYLDTLEKEMPLLNRFLSFNQMIEGFSREYYDKESLEEMISIDEKKKKKTDAELKYRISYMIKNVNEIYNFQKSKCLKIANKIALGRNYYIHHDKSKRINQLTRVELRRYTCFLEDILLANIYLELGIEKNVIKEAFKAPIYYKISDL